MTSFIARIRGWARRLKQKTYTLYWAYRDPATPWVAKAFAAVVVAYAFSPLDLIPDFIPILGYLDDLILVPLGIALALKMIPTEVLENARQKALQAEEEGYPKSRLTGVIIVLIWLLMLGLAIFWVVGLWESGAFGKLL
jgi:uncharacterized membrane protein YkvA (DUF1232 family)